MRPHPPSGVSEFLLAYFAESFPGAERLFRLHQNPFSHLESAPRRPHQRAAVGHQRGTGNPTQR